MKNIISLVETPKIKIGISTSVLFDMSEPDAVWKAEQKHEIPAGSYHRYMIENIDKPLNPHAHMFDIIQQHLETERYELVVMSRNSVLTGMRAIKTLVQKGIIPNQFVFTNGAPIAEYCPLYKVDRFFTTNTDDAHIAHMHGIAPAIYTHPMNLNIIDVHALLSNTNVKKLYTKPHIHRQGKAGIKPVTEQFNHQSRMLNYAFDFDKVLSGPESDDFFASSGFNINQYRKHELDRLHIEMQKAPWFNQYEMMMGRDRAFHKAHINTARGAEAALRMFFTLASWGIEPNGEVHCMSGMDKTPILLELKKRYGHILFLDDGQKNVDRARHKGISTGLVPSSASNAYLGAS